MEDTGLSVGALSHSNSRFRGGAGRDTVMMAGNAATIDAATCSGCDIVHNCRKRSHGRTPQPALAAISTVFEEEHQQAVRHVGISGDRAYRIDRRLSTPGSCFYGRSLDGSVRAVLLHTSAVASRTGSDRMFGASSARRSSSRAFHPGARPAWRLRLHSRVTGRIQRPAGSSGDRGRRAGTDRHRRARTGRHRRAGTGRHRRAGTGRHRRAATGRHRRAATGRHRRAATGRHRRAGTGRQWRAATDRHRRAATDRHRRAATDRRRRSETGRPRSHLERGRIRRRPAMGVAPVGRPDRGRISCPWDGNSGAPLSRRSFRNDALPASS
jgi:hypothetical protein